MSLNIGQGIHSHATLEKPRRVRYVLLGDEVALYPEETTLKPRNLIEEQLAQQAGLQEFLDRNNMAPNHTSTLNQGSTNDDASLRVEDIDDRSVLSFLKALDPKGEQARDPSVPPALRESSSSTMDQAQETNPNDSPMDQAQETKANAGPDAPKVECAVEPQEETSKLELASENVYCSAQEDEKKEEFEEIEEEFDDNEQSASFETDEHRCQPEIVLSSSEEPMDDLSEDGVEDRSFQGVPEVVEASPGTCNEEPRKDEEPRAEVVEIEKLAFKRCLEFEESPEWNPRPLWASFALLAACNLISATWALSVQSFYPLEVCAGLTVMAVALPPLFSGQHSISAQWSSIFLILYGIQMVVLSAWVVHPHVTHKYLSQAPMEWLRPQEKSVAKSLHLRRHDHLYHGRVPPVPLPCLVVYEVASLVWLALRLAPHLWGSTTITSQARGGVEMLALLVCLMGMAAQALIHVSWSERLGEISAELQSSLGWTERNLLNAGEVLFWLGIVALNLPNVLQSKRPVVSYCVLGAAVLGFLWTAALHMSSNAWAECPHPLAVVESASLATFMRYDTSQALEHNRTAALWKCMETRSYAAWQAWETSGTAASQSNSGSAETHGDTIVKTIGGVFRKRGSA